MTDSIKDKLENALGRKDHAPNIALAENISKDSCHPLLLEDLKK